MSRCASLLMLAAALIITTASQAELPSRETFGVQPDSSVVSFTGLQEGQAFSGSFNRVTAVIVLDSENPGAGSISATVDTRSVSTDNADRDTLLVGKDWLATNIWPDASFRSTSIEAVAGGKLLAKGLLTLRDNSHPAELLFSVTPSSNGPQGKHFVGDMTVQRLDFGIGQGDWADTRWIANAVDIHVDVRLVPQASGIANGN